MIWIKAVPYLIGVALIAGAGYAIVDSLYQRGYNARSNEVSLAQAEQAKIDTAKLRKLEGDKNANMVEVERLRANNHAQWLRLRIPATGCSSQNTTAGSGPLPEDAPSSAERAINSFADSCGEQAYQADAIVESCRVLNSALSE